jgi:predicted nucleic acid-binding protein
MDVWEGEHHPVISIQVLQELLSVLLKKGIPLDAVDEVSEDYSAWTVIDNSLTLFREGMDIMRTCRISFWDAMIAAAAVQGKADELWTEDLNPGQKYGGVISVNPLA